MMIQMTFRTYMIRRSQALRALRQLAIVKGKFKGLMDLFNNFSCRYQVARDEEERLKFSEKFIVMLLNIESVEGATILVRASKRSMVVKLEAMLDVVDPQLGWGKSLSLKRSTINMQDGVIQKGTAEGVTQAFSKRVEKNKKKKKKELSPQDAAMMIQITFRAYMIRRSQALRALRDLATLKEKVNKHMALFYNISYRRKVARDEDERVRFYEKLLVMLLTIDAIEGATIQMRASKRLMRVKLVAMLDVVDPQPGWFKSLYLKRRTFGMQDRVIQKEVTGDITKGVHMIRQALAKRVEKKQRKKKELSPQDAAMVIQMTFGAYMIRRSRALRALHELDIVKGKLKELMALYNNFSYRRRVARDEEERLKFSERFMVMLISFDAIEGVNIQVRAIKRSLVDKLEAMMDIVDPQPGGGKSLSLKRWAFDMPDGVIQMEVAKGVRVIGRNDGSKTFE